MQHVLARPFLVVATQNPIELEGTYPLPFAQMDRFMIRLRLGYLEPEEEQEMLRRRISGVPIDKLDPCCTTEDLTRMQDAARAIRINDDLLAYIVAVVDATRHSEALAYGASPRAGLDLMRYSQATAMIDGREYVLPDDIKQAGSSILSHRVIIRRGTSYASLNTEDLIQELIDSVPVPV